MAKKKNKRYVLFTLNSGGYSRDNYWTGSYYTRYDLVKAIANIEYYNPGKVINNTVKTMYNTYMEKEYIKSRNYVIGYYVNYINKYLIAKKVNNELEVIEVRDLLEDINKAILDKRKAKVGQLSYNSPKYKFREEPVPYIHKSRWHRGSYYRHPGTSNAKRNNFYEDDYGVFIDTKIKSLPTVWDEIVRHKDKSWKTYCKVRKQWEKHCKRHTDTVKYNKKIIDLD